PTLLQATFLSSFYFPRWMPPHCAVGGRTLRRRVADCQSKHQVCPPERVGFLLTGNPVTRKKIPATRHCSHATGRRSGDVRHRRLRACRRPPLPLIPPIRGAVFRRAVA